MLHTYATIHICIRITYWRNNNRRAKSSLKKYTSHFIARFACERELETEQRLQYIDPHSYGHQRCVFLVLLMLNRRPGGQLCWLSLLNLITNWSGPQTPLGVPRAPSAGCWLSLPQLVSNSSDLQLTDFRSPPSYIVVQSPTQSPTQSLEWHVWSSSSGNNCHAVQKSLSSGASVYECIMGFNLVPFRQPNSPTRFLLITAIGMCHFLPVHHFGMACLAGSKVNIQQKYEKGEYP